MVVVVQGTGQLRNVCVRRRDILPDQLALRDVEDATDFQVAPAATFEGR